MILIKLLRDLIMKKMNKKELESAKRKLESELSTYHYRPARSFYCDECEAIPDELCREGIIFRKETYSIHKSRNHARSVLASTNEPAIEKCQNKLNDIQNELNKIRSVEFKKASEGETKRLQKLVEDELAFKTSKQREIHITILAHKKKFLIMQTKNTKIFHPQLTLPIEFLDKLIESPIDIITYNPGNLYDYYGKRISNGLFN